jgi:hypothetical protein
MLMEMYCDREKVYYVASKYVRQIQLLQREELFNEKQHRNKQINNHNHHNINNHNHHNINNQNHHNINNHNHHNINNQNHHIKDNCMKIK